MPVVVISRTQVAARLLRYTDKEKAGQVEPRVLFSEGIRCRVPTAAQEFRATRIKHGTDGRMRKLPDHYELPGAGETATHVRRLQPSGRRVWAVARDGEDATHVRRPGIGSQHAAKVIEVDGDEWNYYPKAQPGDEDKYLIVGGHAYVREAEAVHLIVSFGLDEVNPRDPQQVRQKFEFVAAMIAEDYPGVQAKLVGQADGSGMVDADKTPLTDGGKFHVHAVMNATIAEAMTLDGKTWEAGRKLSGPWTDINRVRDRLDEFIDRRGDEFDVERNQVPVAEQALDKRGAMDRRMAARAATKGTELSRSDRLRAAWWTAIEDDAVVDLDTFKQAMAAQGVAVTEPGWRRRKPPKVSRLSYVLESVTTRGESLGERYTYPQVASALEEKVTHGVLPTHPTKAKAGPPKPITPMGDAEQEAARQAALRMTRAAQLNAWIAEQAREAGQSIEDFVGQWGDSLLDQQVRDQQFAAMETELREREERFALRPRTEAEQLEWEQWYYLGRHISEPSDPDPVSTQPAFDEQGWVDNPPTKPAETLSAAGQRGASIEEVMAVIGAWNEWDAYIKSEVHAEHQRVAEEARRQAEDRDTQQQPVTATPAPQEEQPAVAEQPLVEEDGPQAAPLPSAPAPVSPAPASAAAPAGGRRPFVSALRRRRAKSPKGQETIDRLAAFDETARARLLSGQRLREADVQAAGLGLRALEDYGRDLSDPVLEQVVLRLKKQRAARERFEDGTPGGRLVAEELRDEIALGLYEDLRGLPTSRRRIVVEMARDELAAEMAEREDFEFGD